MWVVVITLTIIVCIIIVQTNMTTGSHTKFEVLTAFTPERGKAKRKACQTKKNNMRSIKHWLDCKDWSYIHMRTSFTLTPTMRPYISQPWHRLYSFSPPNILESGFFISFRPPNVTPMTTSLVTLSKCEMMPTSFHMTYNISYNR